MGFPKIADPVRRLANRVCCIYKTKIQKKEACWQRRDIPEQDGQMIVS